MNIKASGCSALILVAGFFVCLAGPSQSAVSSDGAAASSKSETTAPLALDKYAKHSSHHWKSYAHRKSGKVALKSSAPRKAATSDVAADEGDNLPAIPPSVANANAQFASADTPTSNAAKAMSARANDILQAAGTPPAAEGQVVSADQLNDVDRALRESNPPANLKLASAEVPAVPAAAAPAPPAAPAPAAANSTENSTWDQTSLIGKIFIGFGALLTMASAARMFMA
jgi:hypothetical protein